MKMSNHKLINIFFFSILFCCIPFLTNAQEESDFDKANKLFKREKWEQGKVFVNEGLKKSPIDSDLLMLNGKYYHMKGNNERARFYLMRSIQLDPQNVDAKQILVNVEMESKHYSAAICYVNELLEVNPYWKGLWRKKIEAYKLQGNSEEANRLLKRITQIYPQDFQLKEDYKYSLSNEIKDLRKMGNLAEALKSTDELIKLDSKNLELYSEIINTYLSSGDFEKALSYTNKAISVFPNNSFFIKKKVGILSDLGDYSGAMEFLRSKMNKSAEIAQMYSDMLLVNARMQNQNDPYTLYGKIFEKKPDNKEALSYLLNTSLSRGYYSDAEYFILRAKKILGENKDILYKEYTLYKQIGNKHKTIQLLEKLHNDYPKDVDIQEDFSQYQFELAKELTQNEQYVEALIPLKYLNNIQQNDFTENTLQLLVNVYLKLQRNEEALNTANTLIALFPDNCNNYIKKATAYLNMEKYEEALAIYKDLIEKSDSDYKMIYSNSYEEFSLQYAKKLSEVGQSAKALEVIENVLKTNPMNEFALRYAINNSFKMENYNMALDYSKKASKKLPENIYFSAKLAESYYHLKENKEADAIVTPLLVKYGHNQDLININTLVAIDSSKVLLKHKKGDEIVQITTNALKYNKTDIYLKYYKGLGFQLKQEYDSAYYYQKDYKPSLLEETKFIAHMQWLKYKKYRHQIAFFHLRSKFNDQVSVSGISTLEYTDSYNAKNFFVGRLNYTGRDLGSGYLVQTEWSRVFNKKTYAMFNVAYGTQYFPKIILNTSAYRSVFSDMEAELGLGYRNLPNIYSLFNVVGGISKYSDFMWLNAKANVYFGNGIFYNLLFNSKFYVFDESRSYIQAMTSFGSIPEAGALDLSLYGNYNAFNTMVGLGAQHMINDRLTLGILGTGYNFKETNDLYRNLYNIYIQAYYSL
jgi:YaiO family outer membrane protein